MAGHTTNINLEKPTYSEDADIAVINSNMDIIDGKMGAVGSTNVQTQLNTANTNITNLGKELCAVVAGKQSTTGAATGEYVIVRGSTISGISDGAYIAAKTIPANTNLDSSYFSSTGMTKGIANALNANIERRKLVNVNQVEFTSNATTGEGSTQYLVYDFSNGTKRQYDLAPTGITAKKYDGSSWSTMWQTTDFALKTTDIVTSAFRLYRSGNMVYAACLGGNAYSCDSAGGELKYNDSVITVPAGYKPLYGADTRDTLQNKRVSISANGQIAIGEAFTASAIRFTIMWMTGDAYPA